MNPPWYLHATVVSVVTRAALNFRLVTGHRPKKYKFSWKDKILPRILQFEKG